MAEKYPAINGSSTAEANWPSLIERALDDLSRIVRSEAQIFQTKLSAAVELRLSHALIALMAVGVMFAGAICLLAAGICLLHQWLPWWQAFGIVGATLILIGIIAYAATRSRAEVHA